MLGFLTKLKNSFQDSRLGIYILGGGGISILVGMAMLTNEVWGDHRCHLVEPVRVD